MVWTNKEKIKDHQAIEDAKVYFQILHTPGSFKTSITGNVRFSPTLPIGPTDILFPFLPAVYPRTRRTLPVFLLLAQESSWMLRNV
jgi:hypothetical protein